MQSHGDVRRYLPEGGDTIGVADERDARGRSGTERQHLRGSVAAQHQGDDRQTRETEVERRVRRHPVRHRDPEIQLRREEPTVDGQVPSDVAHESDHPDQRDHRAQGSR